ALGPTGLGFLKLPLGLAIEADSLERRVDLFQGLFAEVRNAQQIIAGAVEQIADGKDAALLQAVRRADRQPDLGGGHFQSIGELTFLSASIIHGDARLHGWAPSQ